jgi:MFS family permease
LTSERVSFADVLRIREFRVLWFADAQSAIGDQIARVALSVLVFQQTASAMLTAITYALTFVPALLGGVLLSGLADRLPRRQVMVGCDLIRAMMLGCMAIPGIPIWLLCILLVLAVLTEAPFMAAQSSLMPIILEGEYYIVGTGLRTITNQVAQLAGFAGGGLVIALVGARAGLALDAITFALSAALIMVAIKARPAAVSSPTAEDSIGPTFLSGVSSGLRLIFHNPRLRILVGLSWLAGLYVVPEGVAAPYAHHLGHDAVATGLLLASMPAGTALGTYLWVRFVPSGIRAKWMGPMAVAVGIPLGLCALNPNLIFSLLLWTAAGLFFGYQVQVITEFVRTVPDQQRGQAIGIASSGLLAVQGFGVLLGGGVASLWGVNAAVASAGLLGSALAAGLSWKWHRATSTRLHPELAEPTSTAGSTDLVASDLVTTDLVASDLVASDLVASDRVTPDRVTEDRVTQDRVTEDRSTA